jgi:hypothetical protein
MAIEKISLPPCFKVGKIGASAPAELKLDPRLLQGAKMRKIRRTQTNTRKHEGNVITTHRRVSRATSSSSSSSSSSRISTALPSKEKGRPQ